MEREGETCGSRLEFLHYYLIFRCSRPSATALLRSLQPKFFVGLYELAYKPFRNINFNTMNKHKGIELHLDKKILSGK